MAENSNNLAARVYLRPLGVPLPLGVSGLAIASLVNSGLELHWVGSSQTLEVGVILATVPFALQLIACVFSYLARDGAAGAALGVLALTWLALGLIHVVSPRGGVSGALGLLLLACGASVALSALAVAVVKPLPAAVFLLAAARFALAGVYQLSAATPWEHASGILGLVLSGIAGYCALAFELEALNRPVLPTFRRASGTAAAAHDTGACLERLRREPGVRPTT